jgi:predicted Zn-dependent protease
MPLISSELYKRASIRTNEEVNVMRRAGLIEPVQKANEDLCKRAIHQLGHTYGLGHYPDHLCVMHFSIA